MIRQPNYQRGFIALISTIIMSAVLVALVIATGRAGLFARFDALGEENKSVATHLAAACANEALLALAASTTSTLGSVDVGTSPQGQSLSCTIKDVSFASTTATIHTYASYNQSFAAVTVVVDVVPQQPLQILSWSVE